MIDPKEIERLRAALEEQERPLLAQLARQSNNVEGYEAFYKVIYGVELPEHAKGWIEDVYEAMGAGEGIALEAFRGSGKTMSVTVGFLSFFIGHHPDKANTIIQVSDDKAEKSAKAVADIIDNNPGWKLCFPNVVPDKEKGWSSTGYEVKRSDMDYGSWRQLNSKRKDPSFLGLGHSSGMIIGSHPDGLMIIDDILDEKNTSSNREMETVRRIISANIMSIPLKGCFEILVFTPWKENDPIVELANSGAYKHIKTPAYREDPDGEDVLNGRRVKLTWKEMADAKFLEEKRLKERQDFARMYALDLSVSSNAVFQWHSYPHEKIDYSWPMYGGVDYASIPEGMDTKSADFFAMAYGAALPTGGIVVVDGIKEVTSQLKAEGYVERAQSIFPGWMDTVVEGDGKGLDFVQVLMRKPYLRIRCEKTRGRGKYERLVKEMAPWLESGQVLISDAETPFLDGLRKTLRLYPNVDHEDDLDALYWLIIAMVSHLHVDKPANGLPSTRKVVQKNPYAALGRH